MDGFIATSGYYADFMSGYLGIPRERIHVVYPGLNLRGHGGPRTSRRRAAGRSAISPASVRKRGCTSWPRRSGFSRDCRGAAAPGCASPAGWARTTAPTSTTCADELTEAGLGDRFEHVESPDHASKVRFLQGLDVLSVPTTYREPKGLYILEALANGVPVVQPRHGSFPELIEATGGGLLVNPDDPRDLAAGLAPAAGRRGPPRGAGRKGKEAVHSRFHAAAMAEETVNVYRKYVS